MIAWLKKHHILHSWGKWEFIDQNTWTVYIDGCEDHDYLMNKYKRTCTVCGIDEFKQVKA